MTVKELKENLVNVPDDAEVGYALSKSIPKEIASLIYLDTVIDYHKDINRVIIAVLDKNYLTLNEIEALNKLHTNENV